MAMTDAGEEEIGGEEGASTPNLPHDTLGYYARLNVSPDCSEEEIKFKYRQLVKFYHPDKVEQLKKNLGGTEPTSSGATQKRGGVGGSGASSEIGEIGEEGEEESDGKLDGLDAAATASFAKLQAAYETLGDPVSRAIYDTYGSEGLAAGRDIVQVDESAPSSLRRVREEIEKTRLKEEILREIRREGVADKYGRVRYSGLYHMSLSRHPHHHRGATHKGWGRDGLLSLLDVPLDVGVISLNSNVTVQATDKDTITLGGQIGQNMRPMPLNRGTASQGSLTIGCHREVSSVSQLDLSAQCHLEPGAMSTFHTSLKSSRQLTKDDSAAWELTCTSSPAEEDTVGNLGGAYDHEIGLQVSSSRRLGERVYGEFALTFGSEPGTCLTLTRQGRRQAMSLDIFAGKVMGFSGQASRLMAVPRWMRRTASGPATDGAEESEGAKSASSFIGKASFKARTDALDLELGASKKFPSTQVHLGWGAAVSHRGVFWRLRATHLGQRFLVPVCLTPSLTLPSMCTTFLLPPILVYLGQWAYAPLAKWLSSMQTKGEGEETTRALGSAFQAAASDCVLMVGPALRKRKAGHASEGLVIVQGVYGDLEAFKQGERDPEGGLGVAGIERYNPSKLRNDHKWLDVTIPLQFMCRSDQLVIHSRIYKHQLMGFCKPACEDGSARLLVRYVYKSQSYECVVSDVGGLTAPSESHLIKDRALASAVAARAEDMVEEVAEEIIGALV